MHTYIIYRKRLFAKGIAYVIICASLGIASTYLLKSRIIGIALLILLVLPLPFMKVLLKKFSRKTAFQLHPDYFTVEILNDGDAIYQKAINLEEIKSYTIQFPNEKFNAIKFRLRNDKLFEWSFFRNRQYDEDVIGTDLINNFIKLIHEYNIRVSRQNKITFQPSFYATKKGLFCIIGLSASLIIAVLLFSFQNEKSLPVTFVFSLILIFQLILKRRKDLEYYKKMNLYNE